MFLFFLRQLFALHTLGFQIVQKKILKTIAYKWTCKMDFQQFDGIYVSKLLISRWAYFDK